MLCSIVSFSIRSFEQIVEQMDQQSKEEHLVNNFSRENQHKKEKNEQKKKTNESISVGFSCSSFLSSKNFFPRQQKPMIDLFPSVLLVFLLRSVVCKNRDSFGRSSSCFSWVLIFLLFKRRRQRSTRWISIWKLPELCSHEQNRSLNGRQKLNKWKFLLLVYRRKIGPGDGSNRIRWFIRNFIGNGRSSEILDRTLDITSRNCSSTESE